MNGERKAFEEWAGSETGWDLYWSDNINQYMDHQTNGAWLAWTRSAQRQGYKLVPVEPTNNMMIASRGYSHAHLIYKAMIGAVDE